MSKVFMFNMVSLDGFFEGPDHNIDWHMVDEEFNDFAVNQLEEIGTLVFGRVTYELMKSYWPTEAAARDDQEVAKFMNSIPKYVFSRSLEKGDWENTTVVTGDNAVEGMRKLKESSGEKDIAIFGSANLADSFFAAGLIDEIRLIINPLALAEGTPLFKRKLNMALSSTRVFKNGNVLLIYTNPQAI